VARVVAFIPDLLFGSNVIGSLTAAGHEPVLVGRAEELAGALDGADVLVVDLTAEVPARLEAVGPLLGRGVPALAFFSHVETDVRAEATTAGFDLVVPRSRMARAGADLVTSLAT
jgi:uncharacterized protein YbjT (DUF2867 family)